jgi:hypothetical protein
MFNPSGAKMIRVKQKTNTILVWYGGWTIHEYDKKGTEIKPYQIALDELFSPADKKLPSFTQVKSVMRRIMEESCASEKN